MASGADVPYLLPRAAVRCYERKDFAFVEIDLLSISAEDITLSLQDNRLTLFALNDLRRIAYEWEIYIFPTITARNFQCGMKHSVLGISWLNWGSGEDTSPQQIQSLEIGNIKKSIRNLLYYHEILYKQKSEMTHLLAGVPKVWVEFLYSFNFMTQLRLSYLSDLLAELLIFEGRQTLFPSLTMLALEV
ncbi:hypothetical protein BDN71DRAFT_1435839 [Pleurotus eryngii]|uniref:Uncharacterized protein n=1 Tax=Pleurotus eryngii TaxID=5323 RepID=A0A9P5ZJW7_PLEER|nr:hypothetical protein BDN71DRAFT_1435839 [Pleurotus eryngii]